MLFENSFSVGSTRFGGGSHAHRWQDARCAFRFPFPRSVGSFPTTRGRTYPSLPVDCISQAIIVHHSAHLDRKLWVGCVCCVARQNRKRLDTPQIKTMRRKKSQQSLRSTLVVEFQSLIIWSSPKGTAKIKDGIDWVESSRE